MKEETPESALQEIKIELHNFCESMAKKLSNPHLEIDLGMAKLSGHIYRFMDNKTKATIEHKVKLNILFREEFRFYLKSGSASQLDQLTRSNLDSQIFINIISEFWENYQRFAFALKLVSEKAAVIFKTFFKLADKFKSLTGTANQVAPIAVLAVNELKDYLLKKKLNSIFSRHFCDFIDNERRGQNVPREKIKESIEFFESTYFDFDSECVKSGDRLLIRKQRNVETGTSRHSTAEKFFEQNILKELLTDCKKFYHDFVTNKLLSLQAPEEISIMLKHIEEEQARGRFYIHEEKNFTDYMLCVNENLIELKFIERIQKQSGLAKYFAAYQQGKVEYKEEISNAWKIYQRVFSISKDEIRKIYTEYFITEGKNILNVAEKGPDFIKTAIDLNKKNIEIVEMLGGMLEFDRIRVESIEKILAFEMIPNTPYDGKYFLGARHIAGVLNQKIKLKYVDEKPFGQEEVDLLNLFKIIKHKMLTIKEYSKHLSARLLEEIDMSKESAYPKAMELEIKIIQQIRKESSENDVRSLQQCLKDVSDSQEITNTLKKKTSIGKDYFFLNQLIVKKNSFWPDSIYFEINPPSIIRQCTIDTVKKLENNGMIQFELFNGVSTMRVNTPKAKYMFDIKNIYVMILLSIDEEPNRRMYYSKILEKIKPSGKMIDKAYVDIQRYLIELTLFGLLKSNKGFGPKDPDLTTIDGSDYFETNLDFVPQKKAQRYKSNMIALVPEHIKKAFAAKAKSLDEEQKQYEKDRKIYVEANCIKVLKHAHHQGGGSVNLNELLEVFERPNLRELNVTAKYLKETVENLIHKKYCERVENRKNELRYVA